MQIGFNNIMLKDAFRQVKSRLSYKCKMNLLPRLYLIYKLMRKIEIYPVQVLRVHVMKASL